VELPETPNKIHETLPSSPFPTISIEESDFCRPEPINTNASNVKEYLWAEGGYEIYFQTNEPGWFSYSILQDKIIRMQDDPQPRPSPSLSETMILNETIEDIISSPDGGSYVYTTRSENNILSIYFIAKPEESPVYIGAITGKVNGSYWFTSKDEVLLAVDWQSPLGVRDGYIFILDLVEQNIATLLPNTDEFRNSSYIGVSPDEQWVLFVKYSGSNRNVILKNINTGRQEISALHNPIDFKWLGKENKLVAITFFQTEGLDFQIFPVIYDLDFRKITKITTDPLPISPNREFEVSMSPTINYIAYIGKEENLFLLDCANLSGIK
jgi:hypothetical protein